MPDSGERRQRLGGDRVQELAGVAEVLGQAAPDLEVELGMLSAGDVAVHVLDRRLQALAVHERARVELGKAPPGVISSGVARVVDCIGTPSVLRVDADSTQRAV